MVQIPEPRKHLIHSDGRYANAARAKHKRDAAAEGQSMTATAAATGPAASEPDSAERKAARKRWANLIRHIYQVDPLVCPRCGGMMKIISFITEQWVIRAIFDSVRRTPARMAIAGHSYGAFMTANLLAHSDLFRAGIARSFQAEERTYWQAQDIYTRMSPFTLMSPFTFANKINEPLRRQHRHVPHPERAPLPGALRPRRHGPPGDAAQRGARLPRPRVGHARAVGDGPVAGEVREEQGEAVSLSSQP